MIGTPAKVNRFLPRPEVDAVAGEPASRVLPPPIPVEAAAYVQPAAVGSAERARPRETSSPEVTGRAAPMRVMLVSRAGYLPITGSLPLRLGAVRTWPAPLPKPPLAETTPSEPEAAPAPPPEPAAAPAPDPVVVMETVAGPAASAPAVTPEMPAAPAPTTSAPAESALTPAVVLGFLDGLQPEGGPAVARFEPPKPDSIFAPAGAPATTP